MLDYNSHPSSKSIQLARIRRACNQKHTDGTRVGTPPYTSAPLALNTATIKAPLYWHYKLMKTTVCSQITDIIGNARHFLEPKVLCTHVF